MSSLAGTPLGPRDRKHEFLIVGSGAGGATLARELRQRGKDVLVVERGRFEKKLGTIADSARFYDLKSPLLPMPFTSQEGVIFWRTFQAGGSTVVSCGNGVRCLEQELAQRGVDVKAELDEAVVESGTAPLAESLLSPGGQALRDAARSLGYRLDPMPKFIDAARCRQCGFCVMGCRYGAKWTMAKSINQAQHAGAEVLYDTRVDDVVVQNGRAVGVEATGPGGRRRIQADAVILSGGGLATPPILQRAGVREAGQALHADLFVNVYGVTKGLNLATEPAMSLVDLEFHADRGFLLSPFVARSRRQRFLEAGVRGAMLPESRLLGLMVKTRDDMVGRVYPDGTVSKPVTPADRKRLDEGATIAKEILVKAGADGKSLLVSRVQGAHPGGGAAIGAIVDRHMQTRIQGLFVCDASALPATPGLPPILTIVALAKRLAKDLAG
jgi:choline dehydrogenase-like flavoprotein